MQPRHEAEDGHLGGDPPERDDPGPGGEQPGRGRPLRAQLGEHSQIVFRPLEGLLVRQPWHQGRVVLIGDTVHATVTIKELFPEKRRVALTTVCTVRGNVVIEGDAMVMPTSRETRSTNRV